LPVHFRTVSDDRPFALKLQKCDTVKTAKVMVAKYLGLAGPESVTLLFKGRALAEVFVLSRLRIGNASISVYVRDATEVLLVTGRAMRSTVGTAGSSRRPP
jgi:hypothetical protein